MLWVAKETTQCSLSNHFVKKNSIEECSIHGTWNGVIHNLEFTHSHLQFTPLLSSKHDGSIVSCSWTAEVDEITESTMTQSKLYNNYVVDVQQKKSSTFPLFKHQSMLPYTTNYFQNMRDATPITPDYYS